MSVEAQTQAAGLKRGEIRLANISAAGRARLKEIAGKMTAGFPQASEVSALDGGQR